MADRIVDNKIDLGLCIDTIISEAMKGSLYDAGLDEKEKQDAVVNLFGGGDKSDGDDEGQQADSGDDQSSDGSADDKVNDKNADDENLKSGDVKMSDVVDKLNIIRSGHSLKDSAVKQNMESYIDNLSATERVALLAFLEGIGQILTGVIPAQQAPAPAKDPADVHMHKNDSKGKETHHVKPNVVKKAASAEPPAQKTAGEDTTPPIPIAAKRRK